jgi:hypothetical protein
MVNENTRQTLIQIISGMLIFLFSYTAISKLMNHTAFRIALITSTILSNFAAILSWAIPATEIVIVCLLLIPRFRSAGLLASAILMTIFTFYIGYMLLFVSERACSCGGVLAQMTWFEHLLFNICFTLVSFTAYMLQTNKRFIAINRTSRTPA